MYVHIVSLRSTSTKLYYYWARNQINSPKAKCTVLHTFNILKDWTWHVRCILSVETNASIFCRLDCHPNTKSSLLLVTSLMHNALKI